MYVGIDVGGTNLVAGFVTAEGSLRAKVSRPIQSSGDPLVLVNDLVSIAREVCQKADVEERLVRSIGIGLPGSVDKRKGDVVFCCNIPSLTARTPLSDMMRKQWDIPIHLENDANAAALGEAHVGAAKGCRHSVMITIGTGVGGGIIIDGLVYSGFNDVGGELGHMVICHQGRPCGCGRRGCWEAYASATGLILDTKESMQKHPDSLMWQSAPSLGEVDGRTAFDAARKGDGAAAAVVRHYIEMLACGLTSIVNIFQPEVLCIGGGIGNEGAFLIEPLAEIVHRDNYNRTDRKTRICQAVLGNDAGVIGAALSGPRELHELRDL